MRRNAPDVVPVTALGRLAVDLTHQGKGVGAMLLRDALSRSLRASRTVGSRAVLLHAKSDRLFEYYMRFGFRSLPQHPFTMVLPMERIATSLAPG
jgi:predicted N-acetyltransferase YhbS